MSYGSRTKHVEQIGDALAEREEPHAQIKKLLHEGRRFAPLGSVRSSWPWSSFMVLIVGSLIFSDPSPVKSTNYSLRGRVYKQQKTSFERGTLSS